MKQTSTYEIKKEQLRSGFMTFGSGPEVILIMGSCRVCNFVSYFKHWNEQNGNRFTIHTLDVFNFNWNENDDRVDFEQSLAKWETDERMLSMLKSVDWFLHEFYKHGGMFNVTKGEGKNIYQYGMSPKVDICLPNFNDFFILFSDILTFDSEMRKKAVQDYNVLGKLSNQTKAELKVISETNIEKFYSVCRKSDVPEMELYFQDNYTKERLFWSYNHTSRPFTLAILYYINRFLNLDLSCIPRDHEDIFANNYTKLSLEDVEAHSYEWNEEWISLKSKILS